VQLLSASQAKHPPVHTTHFPLYK